LILTGKRTIHETAGYGTAEPEFVAQLFNGHAASRCCLYDQLPCPVLQNVVINTGILGIGLHQQQRLQHQYRE
jgi:hypothetical protein